MTTDRIPDNSTLASLKGSLTKPSEFVRKVLDNMYRCGLDIKTVRVRIGAMGTGKVPYYRLEEPKVANTTDLDTGEPVDINFLDPGVIYRGSSHSVPTNLTKSQLHDVHWSSETMGHDDVAALLGELRTKAKAKSKLS